MGANEEPADEEAIDGQRDGPGRHCPSLLGRVAGAVPVHCDADRRKGDGRPGSKQTGAFWAEKVSQYRERRYHDAADEEANEKLFAHLAFFQSFDSGPPLP